MLDEPLLQEQFAQHVVSLHLVKPVTESEFLSIGSLTRLTTLNVPITNFSLEGQSPAAVALASLQSLSNLALLNMGNTEEHGRLVGLDLGSLSGLSSLGLHAFKGSIAVAGTVTNLQQLCLTTVRDTPSPSALQASSLSALTQMQSFTTNQPWLWPMVEVIFRLPTIRVLRCMNCARIGSRFCNGLTRVTGLKHLTLTGIR